MSWYDHTGKQNYYVFNWGMFLIHQLHSLYAIGAQVYVFAVLSVYVNKHAYTAVVQV